MTTKWLIVIVILVSLVTLVFACNVENVKKPLSITCAFDYFNGAYTKNTTDDNILKSITCTVSEVKP